MLAREIGRFAPPGEEPPGPATAGRIGAHFARMPSENLTKIVRRRRERRREGWFHTPAEVLAGYRRRGTGGTCFSLTWALLSVMRELGFEAHPVLADRKGSPDSHCAVIFEHGNRRYFLDPGYLVSEPVRLPAEGEVLLRRPLNDLRIRAEGGGSLFHVSTVDSRGERWRYLVKGSPVGDREFREAWAETFDGPSTRSLLLTRMAGSSQIYFHGRQLLTIRREGRTVQELHSRQVPAVLTRLFGLHRPVVDEALAALGGR